MLCKYIYSAMCKQANKSALTWGLAFISSWTLTQLKKKIYTLIWIEWNTGHRSTNAIIVQFKKTLLHLSLVWFECCVNVLICFLNTRVFAQLNAIKHFQVHKSKQRKDCNLTSLNSVSDPLCILVFVCFLLNAFSNRWCWTWRALHKQQRQQLIS